MYYVLNEKTEETIAMTHKADVAEMIQKLSTEPAIIRFTERW